MGHSRSRAKHVGVRYNYCPEDMRKEQNDVKKDVKNHWQY